MYDVLSSRKKNKKVSFIEISPFEKWNLPSGIVRNWFQLSPLFLQRQLCLRRHLPNTRLMIAWFYRDFSRFLARVSAKFLLIQKLNLEKICLKAVVKVAPSLQRLPSARQVKISNHTMIVPSQLPPKKKLPMYRGRRAWGHASELICWRDRSIRLVFYLVFSSRFFLLLSMCLFIKLWSIFVIRANFK